MMIDPSEVNYNLTEPYYYVDSQTLQFASDLGKYTAFESYMDLASASSLSLLSGGTSGSSIFLLHAKGELAMYKYLNVKFPKTLLAYYYSRQFKGEVRFDRNFLLIAKLEYVLLSLNYIFMQDMPLAQCYIYTIISGF